MDPDRSRRLVDLFQRALELSAAERVELLERECEGDAELRERVERLLRDDSSPSSILDEFDSLRELDRFDPMLGQELGPYRLTTLIARGGMGIVYGAERTDGAFDRDVAIKLIRTEEVGDDSLRRFEQERRVLARLDHENIARLYDGGTSRNGRPYLVMEYIDGLPIDEYCDQHELDIAARLRLFIPVCRAVQSAHQSLIVHRDLKPSNVLVDRRGVPKLLDFGIARIFEIGGERPGLRDRTMTRLLTPEYASPEQLAGAQVTTATDVYSLGVVLYGLLTGRRPFHFTVTSPHGWEREMAERPPTRPSSPRLWRAPAEEGERHAPEELARLRRSSVARLRRRLTGDLDRIVLMALRKEPERRYRSPAELADDLERHLEGRVVLARGDSLAYVVWRFARRNRTAVAAGVAVLAALVIGIVAERRGRRYAQREAAHARIEAASFQRISTFLTDTLLHTHSALDDARRRIAVDDVRNYATNVRIEHADDPHLQANLLDELGQICLRLGLLEDSEELTREALQLRLEAFGRRSLEVALSFHSLGDLHFRRGEFEQAAVHLRQALQLHRTCPIGTHTDVATAANDLAVILRNTGETQEAERLHREALHLRRSAGDGSPAVAESLNNLAGILLERGEFPAADQALSEALVIRRRVLGEGALATGQTFANLAQARWGLQDLDGAQAHLERAEAVFRELRAQGLNDLGKTLSNMATIDIGQGNFERAEERLIEASEIQLGLHGPEHPDIADTLRNLAGLQLQQGRQADARLTLEEVLRIRRAALPGTSPLLGRTLQEYGTVLMSLGAFNEAEQVLLEAVAILAAPPVSHELWLGRAEVALARSLVQNGRTVEGHSTLRQGAARLESTPGATPADLAVARQRLGEIDGSAQRRLPDESDQEPSPGTENPR